MIQSSAEVLEPAFEIVEASPSLRQMVTEELTSGHRHWHGLVHHGRLIETLGRADLAPIDRQRLAWAALFHDLVYDARRADNEERSAALVDRWTDDALGASVRALILASKHHDLNTDAVTRLFLLADMDVLWTADRNLYTFYADGIRREYAHVADADYRAGRNAVLTNLTGGLIATLPRSAAEQLTINVAWERRERLRA